LTFRGDHKINTAKKGAGVKMRKKNGEKRKKRNETKENEKR